MGSLLLLNAQWQEKKEKKTFHSVAVSSNHQYRADTVEWFHRSQPTGGGRQFGPSRPVRTETVNTAMPPAVLSGTIGGGEWRGGRDGVRGLTSLYPPVSLNEQKSFLLSPGLL